MDRRLLLALAWLAGTAAAQPARPAVAPPKVTATEAAAPGAAPVQLALAPAAAADRPPAPQAGTTQATADDATPSPAGMLLAGLALMAAIALRRRTPGAA